MNKKLSLTYLHCPLHLSPLCSARRCLYWEMLSLLLLLLFVAMTHGKVTSGSFRLSGSKSEHLLSSFAVVPFGAVADVVFESKQMYENEYSLRVRAYRDTEWAAFSREQTCEGRIKHAKQVARVTFDYNSTDQMWRAKTGLILSQVSHSNGVRSAVDDDRPHYWYFVIDDCSLEQYFQDNKIPTLDYRFSVQNVIFQKENKSPGTGKDSISPMSHLSADQMHLKGTHTVVMLISALVAVRLLFRVIASIFFPSRRVGVSQPQQVHISVLWVAAAAISDSLSSLTEVIHLERYSSNGYGVYSLDAMSAYCEAICDSLLILFLLSIASGWTLPETALVVNPSTSSPIQSFVFSLSKPIRSLNSTATTVAGIVFAVHLALAQWGRTYNDDQESYHDLEHLPGKILMLVRITLGVLFYVATFQTQQACHGKERLKRFYNRMGLVGLAWFLSLPALTFVCNHFVPYYQRLPTVFIGSCLLQCLSIISLAWLVTAHTESSVYHQYSHMVSTQKAEYSLEESLRTANTNTNGAQLFGKSKIRFD